MSDISCSICDCCNSNHCHNPWDGFGSDYSTHPDVSTDIVGPCGFLLVWVPPCGILDWSDLWVGFLPARLRVPGIVVNRVSDCRSSLSCDPLPIPGTIA